MRSHVPIAIGVALAFAAGLARAQSAIGDPIVVRAIPGETATSPCVAGDEAGRFLVAWDDSAGEGNPLHIAARWYDEKSEPLTEILPLTDLQPVDNDTDWYPTCSWGTLSEGPVVGWLHSSASPYPAGEYRAYDAAGSPWGDLQRVPVDFAYFGDLAAAADGSVWLAWATTDFDSGGLGVYALRVDPRSGTPRTPVVEVAPGTTSLNGAASVAALANGGAAVVWSQESLDGTDQAVFGRILGPSGEPATAEFALADPTGDWEAFADVASSLGGGFVVTWSGGVPGLSFDVFARRYDAEGVPVGEKILVNQFRDHTQAPPVIAADLAGNFVVAWHTDATPDPLRGHDIFLRAFRSDGTPVGDEMLVNLGSVDIQQVPAVALSESGLATVAWVDYQSEGADLDWHILARRFALPCLDDGASLCLGGRFRVTAQWRTADGSLGIGRPRPLGADSGAFWFFGEPNLEIVVKVLDGCAINQKHWIYVAGLTDVAVQLAVLDTWTGEVWSTTTDLLERFPATQDVEALGGCQATAPNAGTLPPAASVGSRGGLEASLAETTGCLPDESHLCLQGGRFLVGATYATDIGLAGEAHAVPLEPDSGGFWFFGPDNLELLVKVLDACVPFERYWVYAAGLTNVGVTLVVEDTSTGAVREYRSPLGTPFAPVHDASAFATCAPPAP